MIVLGLGMVALSTQRGGSGLLQGGRAQVDDVFAPALDVLAQPVRSFGDAVQWLSAYVNVAEQNRRLRSENLALREWFELSQAMRLRMERFETLLNVAEEPPAPVVTARVVGETGGPFVNARLITAGARHGVKPQQPVVTAYGVLGRTVAAGRRSARVLELKDLNARTPVIVARTGAQAVLAGDNTDAPRLDYLTGDAPVAEGDRIVTSGDGGLYPPGLPVGAAWSDEAGVWRVRLFVDRGRSDFVRVLAAAPSPPTPEADPSPEPPPRSAPEPAAPLATTAPLEQP